MGAAIEKNFFDFYFSDFSPYSQNVWIDNIFLFSRFSHSISTRILFFYFFLIFVWILVSTLFFRLSYLIISTRLKFVILYSVLFFRLSIVSTRFYSLNFTRINFDLFQYCRFYALTLQLFISLTILLVINKHLCLYEFVLCLFWLF